MCCVPPCTSRNSRCTVPLRRAAEPGGRVDELGDLVHRPGGVVQRRPVERLQPQRDVVAGRQRRLELLPHLGEEGRRRPQLDLGGGVLLGEGCRCARGSRGRRPWPGRSALSSSSSRRPDAEGPRAVVEAGEVADADPVEVAAGHRLAGQGRVAVLQRHEGVLQRVVDAAGAAQAHDVPVVDEGHLLHRHDEEPRLAGLGVLGGGVQVGGVLDARGEAPRAADPVAARTGTAVPGRVPWPAMPSRGVAEQLRGGVLVEEGAGEPGGQREGHGDPAGRGVGVGQPAVELQAAGAGSSPSRPAPAG